MSNKKTERLPSEFRKKMTEADGGPCFIIGGRHKGRIGHYDDDEGSKAVVYFGEMFLVSRAELIPRRYLVHPSLQDLSERSIELSSKLAGNNLKGHLDPYKSFDLLAEYQYVSNLISSQYINGRFGLEESKRENIFISYSSLDRPFVMRLVYDLRFLGFNVWTDDSRILVGQSIVQEINKGISEAEYMLVILSPRSVKSRWVEREWSTKYWMEISAGKIQILPILLESCEIPALLSDKKYANFSMDYHDGLNELVHSINSQK